MECAEELLGTYTEMSQYPSACSPLQKMKLPDQQLEKSRGGRERKGDGGEAGEGTYHAILSDFSTAIYIGMRPLFPPTG